MIRKTLFATTFPLVLLTGGVCAAMPTVEEIQALKEKNQQHMEQANQAYQHSKPSTINLANLPEPNIPVTGSFTQKIRKMGEQLSQIGPLEEPKPKLKLFISFSMSELAIKKHIEQANTLGRDNITLVLRGLKKDNDMRQTSSVIGELTRGKDVVVEIDPPSYERFNIKQVPAFVVYYDDPMYQAKCAVSGNTEKSEELERWEGVYGDVTIDYAIDHMLYRTQSEFKGYLEGLLDKLRPQL